MTFPTSTSASGIWTLRDALRYKAAGQWPRGPVAPTSLAGTPADTEVALTWVAPATTHGTITDYAVEYTPSGGSPTVVLTGSTAASYTVTGLTNDTEYTFRVAAINHTRGEWSSSVAVTPTAVATDPDFADVVLLLHMDGSNGSTTFTDSSSYSRTASSVNGTAQIATGQSKFGGASALFDGVQSGSGSSEVADGVIFADSDDFNMGSSDWTIEAWVRQTNNAESMEIAAQRDADNFGSFAYWFFRINTNGTLRFLFYNAGTTITDITTTETISLNTWHHVAAVRSSGSVTVYVDGVSSGSGTNLSTAYQNPPGKPSIGVGGDIANPSSAWSSPYVGYIDDFRWTIGTARYTANFTPPTAAFPDA